MNKKVIIYFSLFIALLFVFSISIVVFFKSNGKKTIIKADDVYMEATTLDVEIKDTLSVSDEFGKTITNTNGGSFGYVDIEIINSIDEERNFELYVTDTNKTENSLIGPTFVKMYLTDKDDNAIGEFDSSIIPSFADLGYIKTKASSKLLLKGSLEANEQYDLKLRTWISDTYSAGDGSKSFSYEIGIRAVE